MINNPELNKKPVPIKRALLSTFNKTGIIEIATALIKSKIEIYSSGGTANVLRDSGLQVKDVGEYTNFPEVMDGRVKTINPLIEGGILGFRDLHKKEAKTHGILWIDLVICNLYPFSQIILKKNCSRAEALENIDIGGPTLVRSAAKNFKNVSIITNINDYSKLINEIEKNNGKTSMKFRELMSSKAFGLTAYYDAMIANWFNKNLKIKFPERKTIFGRKLKELRYGENPHQKSSIYISDYNDKNIGLNQLSGKELSYNNYNDIHASLDILVSFKKTKATVITKHANPCGVSLNNNSFKSFKDAYSCDPTSAFGGIIACNFNINKIIANEINKNFLEVILAKGFDKDALHLLKKKKNLRIIDISKFKQKSDINFKTFDSSFLIQDNDEYSFNNKKLRFVTKNKPSKKELKEIEFAFNVCKYVKSNAIIITNNFSTIGIGAGQPSRLDSCKIAVQKAKQFQPGKIKNSIAASDAFFPFPDGVKKLIQAGVKIIVQPGGSIRDQEVINLANKKKVKMIFTGTRHFRH